MSKPWESPGFSRGGAVKSCPDGYPSCRQAETTGKWCAGECAAFSATPDRKQPQKTGEPQNRPTEPQTKK